jgi:hypothetical protein
MPPEKTNGIHFLTNVRDRGATTTAQNRRGTAQTATTPSARRVFRPTHRGFGHALSPFRRIAVSPYRRIAVSPYRRVAPSPFRF